MYSRRLVFAAACLGILVFGIAVTALGSLLPSLIARFGLGTAEAGSLFPLLSGGILAGSVVFGPVADRYGYKALLAAAVALILVGIEGLALAGSLRGVGLSLVAVGLGGGVVNGGTSALVADISLEGERGAGLSLFGVFFGIGAIGVPLLLAALLSRYDYGTITAGIGAAVAPSLLFLVAIRFPAPKQPQGFPLRRGAALLRDPVLVLLGICLFFESGLELIGGGWTATYVQRTLDLSAGRALLFLSLYWIGMIAGRLFLGTRGRRLPAAGVLYGALATGFTGALLLLAGHSAAPLGTGSVLLGAGLAAVFPVILGVAGDRWPALSGTAFSLLFTMALVGGTVLPWIVGLVGEAAGLRAGLLLVPAAQLTMAVVFTAARRRLPRPAAAGSPARGDDPLA